MLTRIKHLFDSALVHQGFRRYFANTSWMFAEQILRMVAGLFVGIWVARYLGPEQFGMFSYAVAFASIFISIAKLGLDGIVVRELVREDATSHIARGHHSEGGKLSIHAASIEVMSGQLRFLGSCHHDPNSRALRLISRWIHTPRSGSCVIGQGSHGQGSHLPLEP